MATKEKAVQVNFEILDSNEDNAIFKRIVKSKGRTPKEIKQIEKTLPITTIHYISEEEFTRLKEIEAILIEEFLSSKKENSKLREFKRHFFRFLEI
ncbi:hypothetical protein [Tannerella forsythia]|uniref:Uncharacterized protein n=1 Tax=Tannerella forsythia TaxID=28112 RepID=A0A3P1XK76_TANFO|nr:hypothetical protein [Tannerella forsythia]RRD58380.1 hypothetical protein EII40_12040 [Tannerella forsythia]